MHSAPKSHFEAEILQLYDLYAARLLQYAAALVRDDAIAQDAVQEVFLRYSLMRQAGHSISAPKSWLFRVLRNYLLDRLKTAHVKNEIGVDQIPDAPDHSVNPEQQYASTEIARRFLSTLSPREWQCLRLRSEGLSYDQIAEVLGIRRGTVAALLCRCNSKMQRFVGRSNKLEPPQVPTEDAHAS